MSNITSNTEVESQPQSTSNTQEGHLPDFIVIGAMKAGTTTLFEYLTKHPDVFMCDPKEPQFFSRNKVFDKGEKWYRTLFSDKQENQICGEASTCYSRAPHFEDAAGRMAEMIPDAKLIYILRHPVERAYSHYKWNAQQYHMHRTEVVQTFEEALEATSEFVDSSNYMLQIENYLKHYDREKLLVLTLDDLKSQPAEVLNACQDFLEIPKIDLTAEGQIRANEHGGTRVADYHAKGKLKKMRQNPFFKLLRSLIPQGLKETGRDLFLKKVSSSNQAKKDAERSSEKLSPLTDETRKALLEQFIEPNKALEEFLGKELPASWYE